MPSRRKDGGSAEQAFRTAFERLKTHTPERLSTSATVTQNNVAKEAGCDPSALKKSRHPSLIAEIQNWVAQHGEDKAPSQRQKVKAQRKRNKTLREQIAAIKAIRDMALSKLIDAEATIIDLTMEVSRLNDLHPPSNVLPISLRKVKS